MAKNELPFACDEEEENCGHHWMKQVLAAPAPAPRPAPAHRWMQPAIERNELDREAAEEYGWIEDMG